MTTYAFDRKASAIVAVWESGAGSTASTVARLPAGTAEPDALHLAQALTRLSASAWLSYTDPGLAEPPSPAVPCAVRRPHLPQAGLLFRVEDPVEESAHAVGRELFAVGDPGVTRAVARDVEAECAAVERASRGDLSGRARQAVMLTRLDPSPAQIVAADRLLHDVPMGSERLFTEVEPTAAAAAAVHWLQAAADVTGAVAGRAPDAVVEEAAAIEHIDIAIPRIVLGLVGEASGEGAPLAVAQSLIRSALLAARGMVLTSPGAAADDEPRFTLLDPARPARCLLEGLVQGIQGCCFVYAEYLSPDDPLADEEEWLDHARDRFDAAVRVEAQRRSWRLA